MMGEKEIIFVYSTGRCGTAYLAQVFGQEKWSTRMSASPIKNISVMHEKFSIERSISKALKDMNPLSKESLDIQRVYIKRILKENEDKERIFITSSSIGRFCSYFIVNVHQNYKCIYLDRDIVPLINSWTRRFQNFLEVCGEKDFNIYIREKFRNSMFAPSDKFSILQMKEIKWSELSIEDKLKWHTQETKERWKLLKQHIDSKKFIETTYEKIITEDGLDEISDFIDLPYSKELMKVRVNQSEKYS